MNDIENLCNEYARKHKAYETEQDRIQKQIARLEKKLQKLSYPSWIDEILRPIAEAMLEHLPDRYFDILGPFGMTAETSIHFYRKGIAENKQLDSENCKSLTVRPTNLDEGHLSLVDHKHETTQFSKGTIGEINGMNYPEIPMKRSISELVKWMN